MRKTLLVALLPLLGGCYTETNLFYQPIFQPAGGIPDESFIVIQNINPPFECRVVPQNSMFPAIYKVVNGPVTEREGVKFVRDVCRVRPPEPPPMR
ncbi:MAG: hypothetical protein LCH61_16075 [Proteobacteria bacterium]|nr:hypothetical protein [Pseudomonadota bacterium]